MNRSRITLAIVAGAGLALASRTATADQFQLANAGTLRGQLLNPDEQPRKKYVVRTSSGAVVTLDRTQVVKVQPESARQLEYERRMPTYPDTAEGQWALAEWCRENRLNTDRQRHLTRVIELEPNHQLARRGLGYIEFNGGWKTPEQVQTDRGFVRYNGEWLLPQEVKLLEKQKKDRASERQWFSKLRKLRGALDSGDQAAEAAAKLRSIDDPYALKAIAEQLQEERNHQVRVWYLESLSKIRVPDATTLLVGVALHDGIEEVRLSALDFLVEQKNPEVPAMFIAALRDKNVAVINRAAIALRRLKSPAAIGPLIDSLVVIQKIDMVEGAPGGIGATFGKGPNSGGGGLSVGQSVRTEYRPIQNPEVLDALIKLTGNNFEYNVVGWKSWFANQKKPETQDGRRG